MLIEIDKEALRRLIEGAPSLSHKELARCLGWPNYVLSKRLKSNRPLILSEKEAAAAQKYLKIKDLGELLVEKSKFVFSLVEFGRQFYSPLGENDVVSIVSADGYLEAHDAQLLNEMVELVSRGVEVRYFYPSISGNASIRDYEMLLVKFRDLISNFKERSVLGFQVNVAAADLFGWKTRRIIISRWNDRNRQVQTVRHGFLYVATGGVTGKGESGEDCKKTWIRLQQSLASEYYRRLCLATEPIISLGAGLENRLNGTLQRAYQRQFQSQSALAIYRKLRPRIDTKGHILGILEKYIDKVAGQNNPHRSRRRTIHYLDIGAGDGGITAEVTEWLREETNKGVMVSIIEPAAIAESEKDKRTFEFAWIHRPLEEVVDEVHAEQFDVITAIHSTYLMDPSCLRKMYNLLGENGILVILSSPFVNNVLNQITCVVDSMLPKYDVKAVKGRRGSNLEDAMRVFAEEWFQEAKSLFGEKQVHKTVYQGDIEADYLLNADDKATKEALELAFLFGSKLLSKREDGGTAELELRLSERLVKKRNGRIFQNENWGLVVLKDEVRVSRCSELHGAIE